MICLYYHVCVFVWDCSFIVMKVRPIRNRVESFANKCPIHDEFRVVMLHTLKMGHLANKNENVK